MSSALFLVTWFTSEGKSWVLWLWAMFCLVHKVKSCFILSIIEFICSWQNLQKIQKEFKNWVLFKRILEYCPNVPRFMHYPYCHWQRLPFLFISYLPQALPWICSFFSSFIFLGGVVQNEGFFIKALIKKMPLTKPVHLGRSEARRVFFRMPFCM